MKSEATGLHLSPSLIKKREGSQGAPELSRARGTRGAKAGPAGAPSRTFRMNGGDSAPHPADPSAGVPAAPRTPRPGRAPGGRIGHLEFGPGVRAAAPAAAAAAAAAAASWAAGAAHTLQWLLERGVRKQFPGPPRPARNMRKKLLEIPRAV